MCYSKVIWLGDLNYRLRASSDLHEQLRNHDWESLLEKDQVNIIFNLKLIGFSVMIAYIRVVKLKHVSFFFLFQLKIEQRAGRIFKGWEEGKIYFAPTYKYRINSDNYVVQTEKSKEKRRTPAW